METPKRRAALAPLDANKMSPAPGKLALGKSPIKIPAAWEGRKRRLEGAEHVVVKRTCVEAESRVARAVEIAAGASLEKSNEENDGEEQQIARDESASPDASSLFDTSTFDPQNNTTVTEPDVAESSRPGRMTREQTRKVADDLQARLRLASYKLKTNQTDIPFMQLEARQLVSRPRHRPAVPTVHVHRPSSSSQPEEREQEDQSSQETLRCVDKENGGQAEGVLTLPPLKPACRLLTPRKSGERDETKLTSSALRGGAANGLLRLSQGVGS